MSLWKRWKSADPKTQGKIEVAILLGGLVLLGLIWHEVEEYRFEQLPRAQQEEILTKRRLDAETAEQARLKQAATAEQARLTRAAQAEQARQERERQADEQRAEELLLEAHKIRVKQCIEAAKKYLPGLWPSSEAEAKIEADCAEREARSEHP